MDPMHPKDPKDAIEGVVYEVRCYFKDKETGLEEDIALDWQHTLYDAQLTTSLVQVPKMESRYSTKLWARSPNRYVTRGESFIVEVYIRDIEDDRE